MSEATLDDGTPVADIMEELKERRAEVTAYRKAMQTIENLCDAPHWKADRRWQIRDIANRARRGLTP